MSDSFKIQSLEGVEPRGATNASEKVSRTIHVGSRESKLALIQTNFVINQLDQVYGNNDNANHDKKNLLIKTISRDNETEADEEDGSQTSNKSTSNRKSVDLTESNFMEHATLNFVTMKSTYEFDYVIETMKTIGDKILDQPLPEIGDKGLFTQELEEALARKSIDFIVHSLKDLPTSLPDGCCIGAILKRENPRDALVLKSGLTLPDPFDIVRATNLELKDKNGNPRHPVIGTSSLRRQSQLKHNNPNVIVTDVRGNITTRLEKLDGKKGDVDFDALILAVSGLTRAGDGHKERISLALGSEHKWYHAVGQGALAIECRDDDEFVHNFLEPLNDYDTIYEILIERSLMSNLEGGCSVPIGTRCNWSTDRRIITAEAAVFSSDGKEVVEDRVTCSIVVDLEDLAALGIENGNKKRKLSTQATQSKFTGIMTPKCPVMVHNFKSCFDAGAQLAQKLRAKGAGAILDQIKEEKRRKKEASGNESANSSFESI